MSRPVGPTGRGASRAIGLAANAIRPERGVRQSSWRRRKTGFRSRLLSLHQTDHFWTLRGSTWSQCGPRPALQGSAWLYVAPMWPRPISGHVRASSGHVDVRRSCARYAHDGALRGPTMAPYTTGGHGSRSRTQKTHTSCGLRDAQPPVRSVQYALWRQRANPTVVSTVCDVTLSGTGQYKARPARCPYGQYVIQPERRPPPSCSPARLALSLAGV